MHAVAFAGPGFGVAVGVACEPILATSTDAGQSWVFLMDGAIVILCPPQGYLAIALPTTRLGFVVGVFPGAILWTDDGGAAWFPTAPSGTHGNLRGIAFINPTTGVAVGEDGVILLTSNGGV
jgi:photosystem II stability/assembly factor-like uncharacterized protein